MWSSNPPRQSIPKNHRSWPLATIAGHSVTFGHLVLGLSLSLSIRSLDNLPAQGWSRLINFLRKGTESLWFILIQHSVWTADSHHDKNAATHPAPPKICRESKSVPNMLKGFSSFSEAGLMECSSWHTASDKQRGVPASSSGMYSKMFLFRLKSAGFLQHKTLPSIDYSCVLKELINKSCSSMSPPGKEQQNWLKLFKSCWQQSSSNFQIFSDHII